MRIIFAKHAACDREFVFEVQENQKIEKGDILWVSTQFGETAAQATSDIIDDAVEELVVRFGATLPLRKVITYANKGLIDWIETNVKMQIAPRINKVLDENFGFLPFG